jgi:hypothetical protein
MKLFSSLSCAHNYGIPIQGVFLSILVVLCCVKNVTTEHRDFICPMPPNNNRDTEWTNVDKTAFRCNLFHINNVFERSVCDIGYGYSFTASWTSYHRKFNCCKCRSDIDQDRIWDDQLHQYVCRCKAGYYGALASDATCTQCPAGKFTSKPAMTSCTNCPSGQSSDSGSSECKNCAAGTYSRAGGSCIKCVFPKWSREQASSCPSCIPGYTNLWKGSKCFPCEMGQSSSGGDCYNCAVGKWSRSGSSTCNTCAAGRFSGEEGHFCVDCDAGTFSSNENSRTCSPCAPGAWSGEGSNSCQTNTSQKAVY